MFHTRKKQPSAQRSTSMSSASDTPKRPRDFGEGATDALNWLGARLNSVLPLVPAAVLIVYAIVGALLLLKTGSPLLAWRDWLTIPAAILAGGLGWRGLTHSQADDATPPRSLPALGLANLAALLFLLVRPPLTNPGGLIIALIFAGAASVTLSLCLQTIRDGDGIGMESSWGGFGGGLGGWRLTRAASLALVVLTLACAAIAVLQLGVPAAVPVTPVADKK
jgi:hypothetical protein